MFVNETYTMIIRLAQNTSVKSLKIFNENIEMYVQVQPRSWTRDYLRQI